MDLAAFAPEEIPWMGPGPAAEGSASVGAPVLLPHARYGEGLLFCSTIILHLPWCLPGAAVAPLKWALSCF